MRWSLDRWIAYLEIQQEEYSHTILTPKESIQILQYLYELRILRKKNED